ncbi:unnamed protein product [Effrenium voratum]|nr:unnamed protein product [Effrenium voratum]
MTLSSGVARFSAWLLACSRSLLRLTCASFLHLAPCLLMLYLTFEILRYYSMLWICALWGLGLATCAGLVLLFWFHGTCMAMHLLSAFWMRKAPPPAEGQWVRVFHGTTLDNAKKIQWEGFIPSKNGMLGSGVYVSRDLRKVWNYGRIHKRVKGVVATGVIMELEVFVGKLCIVDRQGHTFQRRWREEFDTAWVPANSGMVHSNREEVCGSAGAKLTFKQTSGLCSFCEAARKRQLGRLLFHEAARRIMMRLWAPFGRLRCCTRRAPVQKKKKGLQKQSCAKVKVL